VIGASVIGDRPAALDGLELASFPVSAVAREFNASTGTAASATNPTI
jgi:hypothetical protein